MSDTYIESKESTTLISVYNNYVNTHEMMIDRRVTMARNYFLVFGAIISVVGFILSSESEVNSLPISLPILNELTPTRFALLLLSFLGLFIGLSWLAWIVRSRRLSCEKVKMIKKLEKRLIEDGYRPFTDADQFLKKNEDNLASTIQKKLIDLTPEYLFPILSMFVSLLLIVVACA